MVYFSLNWVAKQCVQRQVTTQQSTIVYGKDSRAHVRAQIYAGDDATPLEVYIHLGEDVDTRRKASQMKIHDNCMPACTHYIRLTGAPRPEKSQSACLVLPCLVEPLSPSPALPSRTNRSPSPLYGLWCLVSAQAAPLDHRRYP